ncbi:MAG: DUF6297 family protein [Actinomyces sp.]|uniref:DUF6297 family protein n=1 Tax=Actinomyces sp. TaxID=29317 RepID=UPI0026DA9C6F|nr:DUF6297 family protein [Actinomyces sp.]MDO4244228.1 DUF6297 family protein [Actinomyces sp.]
MAYELLLAVGVVGALTTSTLGAISGSLRKHATDGLGGSVPHPTWTFLFMFLLCVSIIVGVAWRLGPLFLRSWEASWWLSLPGDRRGLLTPLARIEWTLFGVLGGVAGVVGAVIGGTGVAQAVGLGLIGAAGMSFTVLSLFWLQVHERGVGVLRAVVLLASAAVAVVGIAGPSIQRGPAGGVLLVAGSAGLAVAAWCWRAVRAQLACISDRLLIDVASRAFGVHSSVLALDVRALGRLMSSEARVPSASSRLLLAGAARRVPRAWRPTIVIAQADWLLLCRQPYRVIQVLLGLVVAVVPQMYSLGLSTGVCLHLLGGWVAALSFAEPARRAWWDGGADQNWPVGAVRVRAGHLLVPALGMSFWLTLAMLIGSVARTASGDNQDPGASASVAGGPWWITIALIVVCGLGWSGAILRSAYRPSPVFTGSLVSTPVGSLPPGLVQIVMSGPDAAVVAGLPSALVILEGTGTPSSLAAQVAASAITVTWGLLVGRRQATW